MNTPDPLNFSPTAIDQSLVSFRNPLAKPVKYNTNSTGNYGPNYGYSASSTTAPPTGRFNETMGNISSGVSAFGTLAELYLGFKAMSAQKKQFNFQKQAWEKNYANSLKDYDNQLLDRHRRSSQGAAFFGNDYQSLDSYMAQRSLGGYGNSGNTTPGFTTSANSGVKLPGSTGNTGSNIAPANTPHAASILQRPSQTNPMFDRRLLGG